MTDSKPMVQSVGLVMIEAKGDFRVPARILDQAFAENGCRRPGKRVSQDTRFFPLLKLGSCRADYTGGDGLN